MGTYTMKPSRPHPCLPAPRRLAVDLAVTARLGLAGLGVDDQAAIDTLATVYVVDALLLQYSVDGGREAVRRALQALAGLHGGTTLPDDCRRACVPAVAAFEALLAGCTWRRLQDAQRAAARRLAAVPA